MAQVLITQEMESVTRSQILVETVNVSLGHNNLEKGMSFFYSSFSISLNIKSTWNFQSW